MMDRANFHKKSYNIPRSFVAMDIDIKYELRAWMTCEQIWPNVRARSLWINAFSFITLYYFKLYIWCIKFREKQRALWLEI